MGTVKSIKVGAGLSVLMVIAACSRETQTTPEPEAAPEPPPVLDEAGMVAGEEVEPIEVSDAPAYLGVWALEASVCATQPGASDPAPIAITPGEFIGYENFCRIGLVEETGPDAWTVERICVGEGVEFTETLALSVENDVLTLNREDEEAVSLIRCE